MLQTTAASRNVLAVLDASTYLAASWSCRIMYPGASYAGLTVLRSMFESVPGCSSLSVRGGLLVQVKRGIVLQIASFSLLFSEFRLSFFLDTAFFAGQYLA
jgi:hypothetical protein